MRFAEAVVEWLGRWPNRITLRRGEARAQSLGGTVLRPGPRYWGSMFQGSAMVPCKHRVVGSIPTFSNSLLFFDGGYCHAGYGVTARPLRYMKHSTFTKDPVAVVSGGWIRLESETSTGPFIQKEEKS